MRTLILDNWRGRATCIVVAAAAGMFVSLAASSSASPSDGHRHVAFNEDGAQISAARETHFFSTVDALTAESDVVLRGTVVQTRPGRTIGQDSASQARMREFDVSVEEVLSGSIDGMLVSVEELWMGQGGPVVLNGMSWAKPGQELVLFLDEAGEGRYQDVSTDGRYLLTQKDTSARESRSQAPVESSVISDYRSELAQRVSSMTFGQLRSHVRG